LRGDIAFDLHRKRGESGVVAWMTVGRKYRHASKDLKLVKGKVGMRIAQRSGRNENNQEITGKNGSHAQTQ